MAQTRPQELFKNSGLRNPYVHGNPHDPDDVRAVFNGALGNVYGVRAEGVWYVPARLSKLDGSVPPSEEWAPAEQKIGDFLSSLPISHELVTPELRELVAQRAREASARSEKGSKKAAAEK